MIRKTYNKIKKFFTNNQTKFQTNEVLKFISDNNLYI